MTARFPGGRRAALLAAALVLAAGPVCRGEGFALLVGVGRNPGLTGMDLGEGPVHDVVAWNRLLTRVYAFPPGNVIVLTDERATLQGIRAAFRGLASRCRPGDTVVFEYSGHGSQVPDANGDEADGLDEVLCPFDLTEAGANVLVDDELNLLLEALPARQVVAVLDCCFSGTGTKDLAPGRPARASRPRGFLAAGEKALPRPREADRPWDGTDQKGGRAGQARVVFTAGTSAQRAFEDELPTSEKSPVGFKFGRLSASLVGGLLGPADANGDGVVSYAEAHRFAAARIDEEFNRSQDDESMRQNPTLEAPPGLGDAPAFGAPARQPPVARVVEVGTGSMTLDRGAADLVRVGDLLDLFPGPAAPSPSERPAGQARVVSTEAERSVAQRPPGVPVNPSWVAAPRSHSAAPARSAVWVAAAPGGSGRERRLAETLAARLGADLGKLDGVALASAGPLVLRFEVAVRPAGPGAPAAEVNAFEANGRAPEPFRRALPPEPSGSELDGVSAAAAAWASPVIEGLRLRAELAGLTNPAPGFGLQAVLDRSPRPGTNLAEYRVGDALKFGLKASADCWYYILAVDPSGRPRVWCPAPGGDHFAPAGRKLLYPGPNTLVKLDGPPGVYTVKLLAVRRKPSGGPAPAALPRASDLQNLPPGDWSDASVSFRLLPHGG